MPNLVIKVPSVAFTFDKKLLRRIMGQAGREIVATAKSLIGRAPSPSKPGQPPASVTGTLARSITSRVKGDRLTIKDGVFYAKFLEVGAVGGAGKKGSANKGRSHKRGGSKGKPQTSRVLLPRPFISTAAEAELPGLGKRIGQALSKSIDLRELKKSSS